MHRAGGERLEPRLHRVEGQRDDGRREHREGDVRRGGVADAATPPPSTTHDVDEDARTPTRPASTSASASQLATRSPAQPPRARSCVQCAPSHARCGRCLPAPRGWGWPHDHPHGPRGQPPPACAQPDGRGGPRIASAGDTPPTGRRPTPQESHMSVITTAAPSVATATAAGAEGVSKFYGSGDASRRRPRQRQRRARRGRVHRHHGAVGLRQVDAAAHARRSRPAHARARCSSVTPRSPRSTTRR